MKFYPTIYGEELTPSKKYTKKQKLDLIKKVRIGIEEKISLEHSAFTCNEFYITGSGKSEDWYVATTTKAMDSCLRYLPVASFGNCHEINDARQMWLAMLKTLVEAGEF